MSLRVLVNGAGGRMGKEVVKAVCRAADMELVAAVDPACAGQDIGVAAGLGELGVVVDADLAQAIQRVQPERVVDFTMPSTVAANARTVLSAGVHLVIGTTGLLEQDLQKLDALAREQRVGVVHAPNFALGAVLMMRFAREAARFFPGVEIIELHHDKKRDAPSGTAIKTAEMIKEVWRKPEAGVVEELKLAGARGSDFAGVHIHSVRLPGLIAHQEVLFGGPGQTLTIRHDSMDRESFMPGVLLAIRKVADFQGLVYGLEHLLF
ncbi:MAG TPA: 4-hydroxy-tetrahydrodipicolinate reductase [Firmicutes bacterium]|jgi:4-hydroxy-tetrahydrodipicolinate reductase|nr:4-hydroxy-tetrahydrodipicolinate reductase [Bacillota bacterium]